MFSNRARNPNLLARAGRFLAFGASRYEVVAPADGEVYMAVTPNINPVVTLVEGRTFHLIPTQKLEYYFSVGDEVTKLDVPLDFNFSKVLESGFGDSAPGHYIPMENQFLQEGGPASVALSPWCKGVKNMSRPFIGFRWARR